MRSKQVATTLASICFGWFQLGHATKTNFLNIQTFDQDAQFQFYRKVPVGSVCTIFCLRFFNKNISYFISYIFTKFHRLIAFTFWDIGNICIVIIFYLFVTSWISKLNLAFLWNRLLKKKKQKKVSKKA